MFPVVVVGDGAVGTAVAVALSGSNREIVLAGPRGTPEKRKVFSLEGDLRGSADVLHIAIDKISAGSQVIVALKAFCIRDAVADIGRISNGKVLCLSNGMGLAREWGKLAGRVEYGVLSLGFRMTGVSTVSVTDGCLYCSADGIAGSLFKQSQMTVTEVDDIDETRWAKWYANSVINPVGALSGLENNRILRAGLRPLIDKLSLEMSIFMPSSKALAEGTRILEWLLKHSSNKCSMLQDIEKGAPTEIAFLTGLYEKRLQDECPTASVLVSLIKSRKFRI